jgi:hypothetical protein
LRERYGDRVESRVEGGALLARRSNQKASGRTATDTIGDGDLPDYP